MSRDGRASGLLDVRANDVAQACAPRSRAQVESEPTWDITSIHRYALSACRRRLEGGSVKNQDSENVIMCVGFVDTHGPLNPMATANDWISRGFT